ncbi:unnamed protein product [Ectocarpus sp. 12 AP-2014]
MTKSHLKEQRTPIRDFFLGESLRLRLKAVTTMQAAPVHRAQGAHPPGQPAAPVPQSKCCTPWTAVRKGLLAVREGLLCCLQCLPQEAYTNLFGWAAILFGIFVVIEVCHALATHDEEEECPGACSGVAADASAVNMAFAEANDPETYEACSDLRRQLVFSLGYIVVAIALNIGLLIRLRSRPVPGKARYGYTLSSISPLRSPGETIDGWFYTEPGALDLTWFLPSPVGGGSQLPFKVPAHHYCSRGVGRYFCLDMIPWITEVPTDAVVRSARLFRDPESSAPSVEGPHSRVELRERIGRLSSMDRETVTSRSRLARRLPMRGEGARARLSLPPLTASSGIYQAVQSDESETWESPPGHVASTRRNSYGSFEDAMQSPDSTSAASSSNLASLLEMVRADGVFQELWFGRRVSVNRFESWWDCHFVTFTCYAGQVCPGMPLLESSVREGSGSGAFRCGEVIEQPGGVLGKMFRK